MDTSEVLETLPVAAWNGPFDPGLRQRAVATLEAGRVLFIPGLAFVVQPEEREFLSPAAVDQSRKNISFDPATKKCHGTSFTGEKAARLAAMMDRFGQSATQLLHDLLPGYGPSLERARTSFRPVEVEHRPTSPRHDDRLLHVDAFPTRPMHGRRILRLFSNVAPDGAVRRWEVGEPFEDFAGKFLPKLRPALPGSARVLELLGLTKGRRSAYDQIMLGLHDRGKLDAAYQANAPKAALGFPPGSTWIVYTDQVLHAALAGRFALEQTFHLPVEAMMRPELAPLRVLERLAGRSLA